MQQLEKQDTGIQCSPLATCSATATGLSKNPGLSTVPLLICLLFLLFFGQSFDLFNTCSLIWDLFHLLNLLMWDMWVVSIVHHMSLALTIVTSYWGPSSVDIHWLT